MQKAGDVIGEWGSRTREHPASGSGNPFLEQGPDLLGRGLQAMGQLKGGAPQVHPGRQVAGWAGAMEEGATRHMVAPGAKRVGAEGSGRPRHEGELEKRGSRGVLDKCLPVSPDNAGRVRCHFWSWGRGATVLMGQNVVKGWAEQPGEEWGSRKVWVTGAWLPEALGGGSEVEGVQGGWAAAGG